jgi:ABC-type multidrug transport system permease subunit
MSTPTHRDTPATELTQHEFDSRQNRIIGDLSRAMRWVGFAFMLIGALYAVAAVTGGIQAFRKPEMLLSVVFAALAMLFFLALGIWTRRAADSFQRITTTSGQDITHLMDALDNLRKKYLVLSAIVKLYFAILLLSMVLALVLPLVARWSQ